MKSRALLLAVTVCASCTAPSPALVSIVTIWPGASSTDAEQSITTPIEEAVAQVAGVDAIDSVSSSGTSTVVVRVRPKSSPAQVADDVRARLQSIAPRLPPGAQMPVVQRFDEGTAPAVKITAVTTTMSRAAASSVFRNFYEPAVASVEGVAFASIDGGARRQLDVLVDGAKARALGMTTASVATALHAAKVRNVIDVSGVVIGSHETPVHVSDVAVVSEGARMAGRGPLVLEVWKQPGVSADKVFHTVHDKLDSALAPPGFEVHVDPATATNMLDVVVTGADLAAIDPLAHEIEKRVAAVAGVSPSPSPSAPSPPPTPSSPVPQRRLVVDHDRAAAFGVRDADVATALRYAVEGEAVTQLDGLRDVDVRVAQVVDANAPLAAQIFVEAKSGLVPASDVATETMDASPALLERHDRKRAVHVCAPLSGSIDDAVRAARAKLADLPLPAGVAVVVGGAPLLPVSPCAVRALALSSRSSP